MKCDKVNLRKLFSGLAIVLSMVALASESVMAHNIPAYQQKDVYETETVKISGITVSEVTNATVSPIVTRPVTQPVIFKFFNSTKQEIEQTVTVQDGRLPEMNLIKDHNYILFAEDTQYRMPHVYVWVKDGRLYNIKSDFSDGIYDYKQVSSLRLYKREKQDPESDRRVTADVKILYGDLPMPKVRVKLVSDIETIETICVDGKLVIEDESTGETRYPALLEEVTYMVMVEDEKYGAAPFPLVAKDKAEYLEGKFFYDHSDCKRVDVGKHYLVNKEDVHKDDTMITSVSGNTTITGMNFKDFLVTDNKLDESTVEGINGSDYDVIDIKVINPHRWEISKLATGEYQITEKTESNKRVRNVYYVNGEGGLQKLKFVRHDDNEVSFTMNSLSLYPVVLEYEAGEIAGVRQDLQRAIEEKESLKATDYTAKSWGKYSGAVEEAVFLIESEDAGCQQLRQVLQEIEKAKGNLIRTEDTAKAETKAALNAAIKESDIHNKADYTADSWKVYIEAVKAAKALAEEEDAIEAECQKALKELERTKAALVNKKPETILVSNIMISTSASYKIAAGRKVKLTAEITPANASNKTIEWKSSNVRYATVDSSGKVTVKKAGAGKMVRIIAAAKDGSGKKSECQIKIMKHAVKKIILNAKKTVKAGKKITVKAKVKTTGKKANKKLEWKSSNTKYATVNEKGVVAVKKAGKGKKVKITAKATDGSGKKKTVTVNIK